jgi:hypothetical protein
MSELRIIIPHRTALRATVCAEDTRRLAIVLDRQLPIIAEEYGRAAAVIEHNGVSHLIATRTRRIITDDDFTGG